VGARSPTRREAIRRQGRFAEELRNTPTRSSEVRAPGVRELRPSVGQVSAPKRSPAATARAATVVTESIEILVTLVTLTHALPVPLYLTTIERGS
jgi:hypothetical protein